MLQAQLGYSADGRGNGIAYARLTSRTGERLVRAAFRVQRLSGLDDREVAYGALTAIAAMLHERNVDGVRFTLPDEHLVVDLHEHRAVPPPLVLPYVRLGCALNRLKSYALDAGDDPDLTQRARSEVALQSAA